MFEIDISTDKCVIRVIWRIMFLLGLLYFFFHITRLFVFSLVETLHSSQDDLINTQKYDLRVQNLCYIAHCRVSTCSKINMSHQFLPAYQYSKMHPIAETYPILHEWRLFSHNYFYLFNRRRGIIYKKKTLVHYASSSLQSYPQH